MDTITASQKVCLDFCFGTFLAEQYPQSYLQYTLLFNIGGAVYSVSAFDSFMLLQLCRPPCASHARLFKTRKRKKTQAKSSWLLRNLKVHPYMFNMPVLKKAGNRRNENINCQIHGMKRP
jgi:hypothetical protein